MVGSVVTRKGLTIRLTAERWSHIVEAHDYMAGNQDLVFETIENPDYIVSGERGENIAIRHYEKTSISEKSVVVIYKESETDGFIITTFMTSKHDKILKRGVLWKK